MVIDKFLLAGGAVAVLLSSCASPGAPDSGDAWSGGKADGADGPAFVVASADEALFSGDLQASICAVIAERNAWDTVEERQAFSDDCHGHDFRVTEKTTSTLYGHLGTDRALTLGMKVDVSAAAGHWTAVLARELGADQRLHWTVEVPDAVDARHDYITQVANDMGEYFDAGDAPDALRATRYDALPAVVMDAARAEVAAITERFAEDPEPGGAELADEYPYEILDESGAVVGYAIQVWYYLDHPLFDGGGVTLYYDVLGDLVVDVEWWG